MSAFLCFCVPLFSSRGDGVVQAGALFAADPTKRTIWSLMTLPSSSTVRIFWVGKKSEGHSEKRSQARARVRAQGCLGGGCERGREESAALSVVRSIHSQSRRRWWRCRTPCRCRPARVGVLWGGAQRREGEHGGGGGGAPGTGETEKKKTDGAPSLKKKDAPQTAAASRTCPRPSRRSAAAVHGWEEVGWGACERVRSV